MKDSIVRETTLERVRMAVAKAYPEAVVNTSWALDWEFEAQELALRLYRNVWSEHLKDETVCWPANWWQAVKARWFPQWAQRRWPVRYAQADFTIYRGYPDLVMPERKSVLFSMRRAEN